MENDHSEPLIKAGEGKWLGQKVKVTGTYYPMAHMMDVQNFEVMGKNYSWCDTHKTMDQCNTDMGH